MGNTKAVLAQEKLEQYQASTYFTRKEITRIYKRFRHLSPETVPVFMPTFQVQSIHVAPQFIEKMPELKDNPFVERILRVFSGDGTGFMNFENFLDMFNVLSEQASVELKTYYAFKIYDHDQDGYLSKDDIRLTINSLTRDALSEDETSLVVDKVLEESEMDDDCQISFMEFEHVVSRSPDFVNTFHLRL